MDLSRTDIWKDTCKSNGCVVELKTEKMKHEESADGNGVRQRVKS